MNFHTVKVWLSKLISTLVLMLFIILVPAVASGVVPFWAAVITWPLRALWASMLPAASCWRISPTPRPKAAPPLRPSASSSFSALVGGRAA